jgi:hypothetical protein
MLRDSQSWRARADEYRAFADAAKDAQVRAGYLQLARHCEALAERQEHVEQSRGSDTKEAGAPDSR